jgi:ATP-dependent Clp protease ATP-binding subunit ClpC
MQACAAEEADRPSQKHIGTEHLLIGLPQEQRCVAAVIFNDIGIDLRRARETVSTLERESSAPLESSASFIRARAVGSIDSAVATS